MQAEAPLFLRRAGALLITQQARAKPLTLYAG